MPAGPVLCAHPGTAGRRGPRSTRPVAMVRSDGAGRSRWTVRRHGATAGRIEPSPPGRGRQGRGRTRAQVHLDHRVRPCSRRRLWSTPHFARDSVRPDPPRPGASALARGNAIRRAKPLAGGRIALRPGRWRWLPTVLAYAGPALLLARPAPGAVRPTAAAHPAGPRRATATPTATPPATAADPSATSRDAAVGRRPQQRATARCCRVDRSCRPAGPDGRCRARRTVPAQSHPTCG